MSSAFTCAILRYHHDITTGECLNVGVALYSPSGRFIGAMCSKTADRISRVFPNVEQSRFVTTMCDIERRFQALQDELDGNFSPAPDRSALAFARSILPEDDSALRWWDGGGGLTDDAAKELRRFYRRMVSRYDPLADHLYRSVDVSSAASSAYSDEERARGPITIRIGSVFSTMPDSFNATTTGSTVGNTASGFIGEISGQSPFGGQGGYSDNGFPNVNVSPFHWHNSGTLYWSGSEEPSEPVDKKTAYLNLVRRGRLKP